MFKVKDLAQQSFLINANHSLQSNKLKTSKIKPRGYLLLIFSIVLSPPKYILKHIFRGFLFVQCI